MAEANIAKGDRRETFRSLFQGPIMEVVVNYGEHTAEFIAPKALLSHHSEFFRAACNGSFKEGAENKITLQDCYPGAFRVFVDWLYRGCVSSGPKWCYVPDDVYRGFHLWILGDRLLVPGFKNTVMKDLYRIHEPGGLGIYIEPCEVEYCWKYTTDRSVLRRFVLDVVSVAWETYFNGYGKSAWMELTKKIPDFGNDLLCRLGSERAELMLEDYFEESTHGEFGME